MEVVAWRQACRFYSINLMRARHPAWFQEDLERLFGLLATRAIRPRVAERISFDEVVEAHRRLEAGGLEGKLVLCPDLPSRRDQLPPTGLAIAAGDWFISPFVADVHPSKRPHHKTGERLGTTGEIGVVAHERWC